MPQHRVGAGPVHAALGQLGAPEVVAASDDDRDLCTGRNDVGNLPGNGRFIQRAVRECR